jgi:hypothetical protein
MASRRLWDGAQQELGSLPIVAAVAPPPPPPVTGALELRPVFAPGGLALGPVFDVGGAASIGSITPADTSITFAYSGPATHYRIFPLGGSAGAWVSIPASPVTITGLTANTEYTLQISSDGSAVADAEDTGTTNPGTGGGGFVQPGTPASAAGLSTTAVLVGRAAARGAVTPAAGAATVNTLASRGTVPAAVVPAAGVATASALAGKATRRASLAAAAGTATPAAVVGKASSRAAITPAAGAATPSTAEGKATRRAAISAAAGVATTATLFSVGGRSSITPAAGAATAATLAGRATRRAGLTPAAGMATAATLLAAGNRAAIVPASGLATAAALAGNAIRRASISAAAGIAATQTLTPAAPGKSTISPAAGTSAAVALASKALKRSAPTPAAGLATTSVLYVVGYVPSGLPDYAQQPTTSASWSYRQTGTLWALVGRDEWGGQTLHAAPVLFRCDYAVDSRRVVTAAGDEFATKMTVYTSLPGIKQGDMVLMSATGEPDPFKAGADEVRAVKEYADTFRADAPADYLVAT